MSAVNMDDPRFNLYMGGTQFIGSKDRDTGAPNGNAFGSNGLEDSNADNGIPFENPQTGQKSSKRQLSLSTQAREPDKRPRRPGRRLAVNKPVTEDLDSDDERIFQLKHQGYDEEFIAKKLVEENRVRYRKATIQARLPRIRKVKEKLADEKLDDELSDWHEGDDDKLEQSIEIIDERIKKEMQKLIDTKWTDVSVVLANLRGREPKKYTAKACQERWAALQDGTALKPIELDSDQDTRAEMRAARIAEAKQHRAEKKEAVKLEKQAAEDAKLELSRAKFAKYQEKVEAQQARAAEKEENRRIMKERHVGKMQKIAAKLEAQREWKAAINETKRVKELEERVYRSITGKALNRIRRVASDESLNKDQTVADLDNESVDHADDEDEEGNMSVDASDYEEEDAEMVDLVSDHEEDQFPDGKSNDDDDDGDDDDDDDDNIRSTLDITPTKPKPTMAKKTSSKSRANTAILHNPRSIMTDEELRILLHERGLPRRGANESHPEVVARFAAADKALPGKAVKELLEKFFHGGLRGSKERLVLQLQNDDAANSAAGTRGVRSTDPEFRASYKG